MDFGLSGKVGVVVGGSKGLGRATARALADEGVRVVVAARTAADVHAVVDEIRSSGGEAVAAVGDMTTDEGMRVLLDISTTAFAHSPDIAVSSMRPPAVLPPDPAELKHGNSLDFGSSAYRQALEATVVSYALLARTVIPGMRERRWGRMVNVCAGAAKEPTRDLNHVVSNTARAGVVTLSKTLANEFGPDGITVNTLGTGLFDTGRKRTTLAEGARLQGADPGAFEKAWVASIPVQRAGKPEEMAAVCTFLCSVNAAYITGQFIAVDGGVTRSAW